MNVEIEIIGAIIGAAIAAGWPAWQASKKASRLEERLGHPNGNLHDHRTIRDMLAQLMAQVNSLDDRLRRHDAKQQTNATRIENIEKMLQTTGDDTT